MHHFSMELLSTSDSILTETYRKILQNVHVNPWPICFAWMLCNLVMIVWLFLNFGNSWWWLALNSPKAWSRCIPNKICGGCGMRDRWSDHPQTREAAVMEVWPCVPLQRSAKQWKGLQHIDWFTIPRGSSMQKKYLELDRVRQINQ